MKIKNIITPSGHRGWQANMQDVYKDFAEFLAYCVIYKIHTRLGYRTPIGCWKCNPVIQGSIFPSDLRRVTLKGGRK